MTSKHIYDVHPTLTFSPATNKFEHHRPLSDGHTSVSLGGKPCTPYTYLIGWSRYGLYYYGCRYAKNCHPTDLWTSYFTSSGAVDFTVQLYGEPDIIQIRRVFGCVSDCLKFEHRVLTKMDAAKNPKWLNKRNSEVNDNVGNNSGKRKITNHESGDSIYVSEDQIHLFPDYVFGAGKEQYVEMSKMLNTVDPTTGLKESVRRARKIAEIKRRNGTMDLAVKKAANTRRTTIIDGKSIDQIAGEKISNTLTTKIDEKTGLTIAKARGVSLSKTLYEMNEQHGMTNIELRTRARQMINPDRVSIEIYNSRNELVYEIDGINVRFKPFCREHKLPIAALQDSFNNGGTPIYVTTKLPSINSEHYKQFVGWYAKRKG